RVELPLGEVEGRGEAARVRQREWMIERTSQKERLLHPRGRARGISERPQGPGCVARAREARVQAAAELERTVWAMFLWIVPLDALVQVDGGGVDLALVERHEALRFVRRNEDRGAPRPLRQARQPPCHVARRARRAPDQIEPSEPQ